MSPGTQTSLSSLTFERITVKKNHVLAISSTPCGFPISCELLYDIILVTMELIYITSMKRVEQDAEWPLFCPNEAPGLHEVWGEEFEELFQRYEKEGRAKKTIKAQKLWYAILEAQIETGGPFMLYKDAANREFLIFSSQYRGY